MFTKGKAMVALTKDKLVGAIVNVGGAGKVSETVEFGWTYETLDIVLSKVKDKLKAKKIRVLLADELSYVLRLKIPSEISSKKEREYIAEIVSKKIPEVLEEGDWDYRELRFNIAQRTRDKSGEREVVVFSPVKAVFIALSEAVKKVGLEVEAIEPEAIAKTRDTNPLVGLALKKDIKGKDKEVLNLKPLTYVDEIGEASKNEVLLTEDAKRIKEKELVEEKDVEEDIKVDKEKRQPGRKRNSLLLAFLFLLLVGVAIFSFIYFSKRQKEEPLVEEDEVLVEEAKQSPTQAPASNEEVDSLEYKIQIQNGTGVSGEADVVGDTLVAEGFSDVETANADSFEYDFTEVRLKEGVDGTVFEAIERALNSDYKIATTASQLETDSEFDVVVIVGVRLE